MLHVLVVRSNCKWGGCWCRCRYTFYSKSKGLFLSVHSVCYVLVVGSNGASSTNLATAASPGFCRYFFFCHVLCLSNSPIIM